MTSSSSEVISSLQNDRIKRLVKLRERKARESDGVILIEGGRELMRAMAAGFVIEECYYCPEELSDLGRLVVAKLSSTRNFPVSTIVFAKAAMREGSDGVIGIAKSIKKNLSAFVSKKNPLYFAVEGVEKPGNLGAILRTADAIGVDGVVVLGEKCDVFSPNVIRASIGAVFHVPVVAATDQEFSAFCREYDLKVFGAALANRAINYVDADFTKGSVILCGSEALGLSEFWMKSSDSLIKIPMNGIGDSLNVSVAAAVIAFEAARQRRV